MTIENLKQAIRDAGDPQLFDWLPRDFSQAFVVCVGAGPWKIDRRLKVQKEALAKLNGRSLEQLTSEEIEDWYPLEWQNQFVQKMVRHLHTTKRTMDEFCHSIRVAANRNPLVGLSLYYQSIGAQSKVLSLFARDALRIAAFPIDRHVERWLKKYKLPVDEIKLLKLCVKADINPRIAATAFFQTGGTTNPKHA